MSVRVVGGKVLTVGGKVVTNPDCCCEPLCPDFTSQECESFSASKSKISCPGCSEGKALVEFNEGSGLCEYEASSTVNCCSGFLNPLDGKYYAKKTVVWNCIRDFTYEVEEGLCAPTFYEHYESTEVHEIDDDCNETVSYSGSSSRHEESYPDDDCESGLDVYDCSSIQDADGTWSGSFTYTSESNPEDNDSGDVEGQFCGFCDDEPSGDGVVINTYIREEAVATYENEIIPPESEEETTAQLIARTVAALPEEPDGEGCVASRDLSEDETSFTIEKFRYRFGFTPPASGHWHLAWVERFTPEGGGSPTDTPMSFDWDEVTTGAQFTDWFDVDVPATDGETTIEDIVATCPE